MPSIVIDTAGGIKANAELVPAPTAPAFIRVLGYTLLGAGTTNFSLNDSTAPLTGPLPLSTTSGEVSAWDDQGVFDLAAGHSLTMSNSAAVQVSGHVKYVVKAN